jgi:hypothetical protein
MTPDEVKEREREFDRLTGFCERCGGTRLVTIFNYDGCGSDADDQPCPECSE